jgi:transposase
VKELENLEFSNFESRLIVGACLAGTSVTETTTLLCVSRATVSKVISAYMNHGKATAEWNTGRKSTSAERDRRTLLRIVSKNQKTTAAQVT